MHLQVQSQKPLMKRALTRTTPWQEDLVTSAAEKFISVTNLRNHQ